MPSDTACLNNSSSDESSSEDSEAPPQNGALARNGSMELAASVSQIELAKKTKASFNAPQMWMLILGAILAACAGMVNTVAFLNLDGRFVSHVTGQTAKIAMHIEGYRIGHFNVTDSVTGDSTRNVVSALSIFDTISIVICFWFGSFLCGLVIAKNQVHFGGKSFYGIALLGNSGLLVVATYASYFSLEQSACWAAMACGLQNAMCTMHLGTVVRTTHLTGTVTDLGSTSGRAVMILLRYRCRCRKIRVVDRAELEVDWHKFQILCVLFLSFLGGCYLGALTSRFMYQYAFLVPAGVTGMLGLLYTFFRDRLKKGMKKRIQGELHQVHAALADTLQRMRTRQTSADDAEASEDDDLSELDEELEHMMDLVHDVEEIVEHREAHQMERRHSRVITAQPAPPALALPRRHSTAPELR